MSVTVLGLDVGGANLKAAWHPQSGPVRIVHRPFALWKDPVGLPQALASLLRCGPQADLVAVTMTGELCDCYRSKRQGVCAILDAVGSATSAPVRIWNTQGQFVPLAEARANPLPSASANWLALATFSARHAGPRGTALVLDVGSTTTDLIPIQVGRPVPRGRSDPERLRSGELVYTGVRRTPVCALVSEGVAAELFATTGDVYLLLNARPECPDDRNTADGEPATRTAADLRLARMLGADLETSRPEERLDLARAVAARQTEIVAAALGRVLGRLPAPPRTLILAGEGEFLARAAVAAHGGLARCQLFSLCEALGPEVSRAACAHAVAVLAAEQAGGG